MFEKCLLLLPVVLLDKLEFHSYYTHRYSFHGYIYSIQTLQKCQNIVFLFSFAKQFKLHLYVMSIFIIFINALELNASIYRIIIRDELGDMVTGAARVVHGCVLQVISAKSEPEHGMEVVEQALFLLLRPPPHCLLQDVHGPHILHFA